MSVWKRLGIEIKLMLSDWLIDAGMKVRGVHATLNEVRAYAAMLDARAETLTPQKRAG